MKPFLYTPAKIAIPTVDISLLTVKPLENDKIIFQPGQYVEAQLQNGERLPLSIANTPQENGELEFHIRHNEKHQLAAQWLDEVLKSSSIVLQGPKGRCTLDRIVPGTQLIFLAGGTGYAPIRSLLISLFNQCSKTPPLYFYWGISHPDDAYDLKAIKHWENQHPCFRSDIVLLEDQGWVHEYCANQHLNLEQATVFASGPYEMIQAAFKRFTEKGLPPSHFISDMMEN